MSDDQLRRWVESADRTYALAEIRDLRAQAAALTAENDRYKAALEFYANPESYMGLAILADPPCGAFADDYSNDHGDKDFPGDRFGKRAREALAPTDTKGE